MLFLSSFVKLISCDFFQAKVSADIITHVITAIAKSHVITVINVTDIITNASVSGILFSILNVGQAKVQITTININHTRAARGICIIKPVQKTTNNIKNTEALIQDNLFLQLLLILIIDCHIIAQPHIDPNNQQVRLASHCHIDSLLVFHLVSVNSSIRVSVIKDSVSPIVASIAEYGKIILKISNAFSRFKLYRISGI